PRRQPIRVVRRKAERGVARRWPVLDRRRRMGMASGVLWGAGLGKGTGPNKGLQATPYSVRSSLAPASRRA
ncbi:MAG TPA: hypothetical protein VI542_11625, partial [Candidatus Tectomicrobia bacterium]